MRINNKNMFRYKIYIKKVNGRLNESVLPKKNLIVESKIKRTKRGLLRNAAKYLLEQYGLELKDARIVLENAPRINGRTDMEKQAANAAQTNHRLTRPNISLAKIRDAIAKVLAEEVYSNFRLGRRELRYRVPDGICITMDGDVQIYGSHIHGGFGTSYSDAANATWKDQSYDADEKAADNVFSVQFDDDDFNGLIWYTENLDNEIINDVDDDAEDYETSWLYEDEIENLESNLESINSYKDLTERMRYLNYDTSKGLLEEIKTYVDNIMKEYVQMSSKSSKLNSKSGLRKMEEEEKPVRKAPLQKEKFTTEELLSLCREKEHGDLEYNGYRTTPDGRKYELKVSSVATGGRKIWVWTGSPSVKLSAKAVALYDVKTKTWQKKRNNFIEIID